MTQPGLENLRRRSVLLRFADDSPAHAAAARPPTRPRPSPTPASARCSGRSPFRPTIPGHRHLHRPALVAPVGEFERLLSPGRLGSARAAQPHRHVPDGRQPRRRRPGRLVRGPGPRRRRAGPRRLGVVAHPVGSFDVRQAGMAPTTTGRGAALGSSTPCTRHGAAIAAQLVHAGAQALLDIAEGRPLLVPSTQAAVAARRAVAACSRPTSWRRSMAPVHRARRAGYSVRRGHRRRPRRGRRRASPPPPAGPWPSGFDGIELHAGHGYLLARVPVAGHEPARRPLGRRRRTAGPTLLVEVVRAVRAAVPAGLPGVGPDRRRGAPPRTGPALRRRRRRHGRWRVDAGLDAIHVTAYAEPMVATGITDGHTPHVPGALLPLAARVQAELGVPVIAMGRAHARGGRAGARRRHRRRDRHGPTAHRRPRPPGQAGRRAARPGAPVRLPVPLHRRDLHQRPGAVHGEPRRRPRGATAAPSRRRPPARASWSAAGRPGSSAPGGWPSGATASSVWERRRPVAGGVLRIAERADPDLLGLADWLVGAAVDAGVDLHLGTSRRSPSPSSAAGADAVVWAAGAHLARARRSDVWPTSARRPTVAVRGAGKAAVSTALRRGPGRRDGDARRRRRDRAGAGARPCPAASGSSPTRERRAWSRSDAAAGRGARPARRATRRPRPRPSTVLDVHVIGDAAGHRRAGRRPPCRGRPRRRPLSRHGRSVKMRR